ncbi:MAG: glycosyltransferase family 4 protein [Sulfolobales archaeon]|nr:glycosyltransferase family 4 protein [Sulfolobales archaeon]
MKVVLCHHYSLSFYAGGEKFLLNLSRELVEKGHSVEIRALPIMRKRDRMKHIVRILKELGIDYYESWFHKVRDADVAYFIYAPMIHKFFHVETPRIAGIHGFSFALELQHEDIKRANSIKLIRKAGLIPTAALIYHKYFGLNELKHFDAIHVINKAMLTLYHGLYNDIFYAPLWIYADRYKQSSEKSERFTVLFLGRQSWVKGFDIYVKVAEALRDRGIEFLSTGRSVRPVKGLGFIPEEELVKYVSKAHVVVIPSRIDTFGLAIVEPMVYETPVITTPILAHEGLELQSLIYANSVEEFAKKILEIKDLWESDREEYYRLSKRVKEDAVKYDVNKVFPAYEQMFLEVAKLWEK